MPFQSWAIFLRHSVFIRPISLLNSIKVATYAAYSIKIGIIFGVWFERQNVDKKANLHENWSMQTLLQSLLNISAKFHQNWSLSFWAIPFQSWCIFETQCRNMQNNWGNFSKVAFLAICKIFCSLRGHGPTGLTVNTPMHIVTDCQHKIDQTQLIQYII